MRRPGFGINIFLPVLVVYLNYKNPMPNHEG